MPYIDTDKFTGDMKFHEQQHLRMHDRYRVKNPLSTPFRFKYDSIWWKFEPGEEKVMERFLVEHFLKIITETVISQIRMEKGEEALANYAKMNPQLLLDPYIENRQIWDKMPRTDNEKMVKEISKSCILGLVERYGEELDVPQPAGGRLSVDNPLYANLLKEFDNTPRVSDVSSIPTQVVSDKSMQEEVTQNAA